ncbi:MAG: hypothetical protein HY231_23865 [Acidobacteria bacterium]|nr:hypothetical protein [Acidobacteriota bacterium]
MKPTHSSNRNDFIGAGVNAAQGEYLDGRFFGFQWGRVTDNQDPEFQGRIIANLEWLEEEGSEFETGWLTRIVPWAGPTKMERGRRFAFDGPLPEVGSVVIVAFINGNPADGCYFGQPMYFENDTGAPELEKDEHRDWSLRISLQNGFELMVDTEGNAAFVIPGNMMIKGNGNTVQISSRGEVIVMGTDATIEGKSVLKLRGVTIDQTNYPRPEEAEEVRQRTIEMYKGPPGRKDPGIKKIPRLES